MMKSRKSADPKLTRKEQAAMAGVALAGAVIVALVGYLCLATRVGGSLRTLSYDMPFLVHSAGTPEDIRIVYLDQLDGDVLDRSIQPALLDRLNEAGARAVIYDVIFDEPAEDPSVDRAFAAAMRSFRGVDEAGDPIPGALRRHVFLACGRKEILQSGMAGDQLIAPTDDLLDAADDFGLVAFVQDDKFTVRELIPGTRAEPSLAWKAAIALGAKLDDERRLEARWWLNYAGPPPPPEKPEASSAILSCGSRDVLNGSAPGLFRNKIIVIGGKPGIVGAIAGADLFSTPYHRLARRGDLPLMSGVEIQANALSNYLAGNWLMQADSRTELYLVIGAGLLAGAGFTRLRPSAGAAAALVAIFLLIAAGIATVLFHRVWFHWSIVAFLQIPLAFVWSTGARYYVERFFRMRLSREQAQLHDAFSKYLSPQMLQKLIDDGFKMEPGGTKARAAMMFTDIASFTDMCEEVDDSARIVSLLNDYFERTTKHIFATDGVIIKFIGDAIFAAWGVPKPEADVAGRAASAALELHRSHRLMVNGKEYKTRIGLHYGEVLAGHIGSSNRVDYTLIGDAVNLTARLEGLNKMLETDILVSDEMTRELGGRFLLRKVGSFRVKGRKGTTVVHELLGQVLQNVEPPWLTAYHSGIAELEAGKPTAAKGHFLDTIALRGSDGPSSFFLAAIERGELSENGICELKEK